MAASSLSWMPGLTDMTDQAELVRRAAGGDVSAFEALYRANVGKVYGLCLRMTGRPGVAEDCAQEAFVKAWHGLANFRGDSAFSTWLHRIAVNEVLGWQRKESRRGAHLELVENLARDELPGHHAAQSHEDIDMERAIGALPEGARNVFVLAGVYGYSHQEIADMLGVATGTCKAQFHRAKRLIAERLR